MSDVNNNPLTAGLRWKQGTCLDATAFVQFQAVKLSGPNTYVPCDGTSMSPDTDADVAGIVLVDRSPGQNRSVPIALLSSDVPLPVLADGSGVVTAGSLTVGNLSLSATVIGAFAPAAQGSGILRAVSSGDAAAGVVIACSLIGAGGGGGASTLQAAYNGGPTIVGNGTDPVEFELPALTTTVTPAFRAENTTAATALVPVQNSPSWDFLASAWQTVGPLAEAIVGSLFVRARNGAAAAFDFVMGGTIGVAAYLDSISFGSDGLVRHLSPSGLHLQGGTNSPNYSYLQLDDTAAAKLGYGPSGYIQVYGNTITAVSAAANGDGQNALEVGPAGDVSDAGKAILKLNAGPSDPGRFYHMACGTAGVYGDGDYFTASGTATAGKLVAWSGASQVAKPAATENLTTIAGVALASVASGLVKVITRGPVMIDCDAGVSAGDLLVSSGSVAGNVTKPTVSATNGAIVGRAMEAVGATTANKVKCYVGQG